MKSLIEQIDLMNRLNQHSKSMTGCGCCGNLRLALAKLREVVEAAEPFACSYQPERLVGIPLGMHHCPLCGTMQVAGVPHVADVDELRDALTPMKER